MAGRNSRTIVPGRRRNFRRGQNSPEFKATGTTGTFELGVEAADAGAVGRAEARRNAGAFGEDDDRAAPPSRPPGTARIMARTALGPPRRSIGTMRTLSAYQP